MSFNLQPVLLSAVKTIRNRKQKKEPVTVKVLRPILPKGTTTQPSEDLQCESSRNLAKDPSTVDVKQDTGTDMLEMFNEPRKKKTKVDWKYGVSEFRMRYAATTTAAATGTEATGQNKFFSSDPALQKTVSLQPGASVGDPSANPAEDVPSGCTVPSNLPHGPSLHSQGPQAAQAVNILGSAGVSSLAEADTDGAGTKSSDQSSRLGSHTNGVLFPEETGSPGLLNDCTVTYKMDKGKRLWTSCEFTGNAEVRRSEDIPSNDMSGSIYKCFICDTECSYKVDLVIHSASHADKKGYTCKICQEVFRDSASFNMHMKGHVDENPSILTQQFQNHSSQEECSTVAAVPTTTDRQADADGMEYICKACNKSFSQPSSLMNHILEHTDEASHTSSNHNGDTKFHTSTPSKEQPLAYTKSFPYTASLKFHFPAQTLDKALKPAMSVECKQCDRRFKHQYSLKKHMINFHGEKPFSCDVCHISFAARWTLNCHKLIHSGEKVFTCDFCGKVFTQPNDFDTHLLTHTGAKPFSCSVCGKLFSDKKNLKKHMVMHSDEKPHSCTECSKSFRRKSELRLHMLTHSKEQFTCTICAKTYPYLSSLKYHMTTHTNEKQAKCKTCGKSIQRNSLKKHMVTYHGEKPFSCDVCQSTFAAHWALKSHRLTHSDEKVFTCDICGKVFTQPSDFDTHLLTHTREKPFSCSVCSKSFSDPEALKKHMVMHSDKKPHTCTVCSKSFRRKHQLTTHILTHSQEQFACPMCSKSYPYMTSLKYHMASHTKEKRPKCKKCGKHLACQSSLRRHLEIMHPPE